MSDSSVFSKFAGQAVSLRDVAQQKAVTPEGTGQAPYQAYLDDRAKGRQSRLKIVNRDGSLNLLSYSYLMEVICSSHQFISLIYSNCVITLEGRNLTELVDKLQDERVRSIHCFHAGQYASPTDGEPLITEITRQSLQELSSGRGR